MSATPKSGQNVAGFSRRTFLRGTGGALAVATVSAAHAAPAATEVEAFPAAAPRTPIQVGVNRTTHRIEVEDRWTLVELLRDHLG